MKPKSHTLFHFTRTLDTLKQILKNGYWPRYCLEDISWLGHHFAQDFIAYPMVCFCDIPLSRIDDHVQFYGDFGIGMTREWANKNSLNPVLYVSGSNLLVDSLSQLVSLAEGLEDQGSQETAYIHLRFLMAFTKPSEGNMIVSGKPVEKEFYQESEWRYVPRHDDIADFMHKDRFDDDATRTEANENTRELCSVRFSPGDIRYIFVRADADIPSIMNFIQSELDHFPAADLKVLMSRVTSLESIRRDI